MPSRLTRLLILASPILLTACVDGWEMVRTTDFPYGNQRTAGTGVAYVRAKMMPEKELKLEPAPAPMTTPPPPVQTPVQPSTEKKMEEVFKDKQEK